MLRATPDHRSRIEVALAKQGITHRNGRTVRAYVNHGRWVADCPCNGAELVAPGLPMLCGSCGRENTVQFPKGLPSIERALKPRPSYNQNWIPGETVRELRAENVKHGLLPKNLRAT